MFGLRALFGIASLVTATGLQFVGPARPENRALDAAQDMHAFVQVPSDVEAILQKGCVNCHTNQTAWPWYARFAPVSWLANQDVARGREVFNMSEWGKRYSAKPAVGATMLVSGCASMQAGRMPLPQYRLMHPDAKLSPPELERFCGWAKTEARALVRRKRL